MHYDPKTQVVVPTESMTRLFTAPSQLLVDLDDEAELVRSATRSEIEWFLRQQGYRPVHGIGSCGYRPLRGWQCHDFHVVAIDVTGYWAEGAFRRDRRYIERIEVVRLYDANSVTHCCELTSSYSLQWVEERAIFKEGMRLERRDSAAWDRMRERVEDVIRGEYDSSNEFVYDWCSNIDAYVAKFPDRHVQIGNPGISYLEEDTGGKDDEERERKIIDQVIEDWHANPQL